MKDKKNLIIISGIMTVVATSMFLIVEISALFLIAYVFCLIGIGGLLFTAMYLVNNRESYPWAAAIPMQMVTYLIIEILVSVLVVGMREFSIFVLPTGIFAVIHIVILAFFAIRIVMLRGGKEQINNTEEKNRYRTCVMQELNMEAKNLLARTDNPELKGQLEKLAEEIRYSDPVTGEKLAEMDLQLLDEVKSLLEVLEDSEEAQRRIRLISTKLKERNLKAKLTK